MNVDGPYTPETVVFDGLRFVRDCLKLISLLLDVVGCEVGRDAKMPKTRLAGFSESVH